MIRSAEAAGISGDEPPRAGSGDRSAFGARVASYAVLARRRMKRFWLLAGLALCCAGPVRTLDAQMRRLGVRTAQVLPSQALEDMQD